MTTAVQSPVTEYAEAVVRGDYLVGKRVLQACQRHLDDLVHGHERGIYFDPDEAQFALDFFRLLRLADGNGAGLPFELLLWQAFVVGSIFGWKRADTGLRRFRYVLVEVARSNGKSPLAGGIGDYMLIADGEQGAQVYSAATTRDQAKIVFLDGVNMAKQSPALWNRLSYTVNNLAYAETQSYFRPLSADASKMDGLRVHGALVDELHEHPDDQVVVKLRTGMKSTQPLLFMISTAGSNKVSALGDEHELGIKILDGALVNDAYFVYIATLDDDDEWDDEECWIKANPSLGVTVTMATLREECELAKQMPSKRNSFRRLRLNQWTQQETIWITSEVWARGDGAISLEGLKGRKCFAGIHATIDLACLVLWFPDADGGGSAVAEFFVPEDRLSALIEAEAAPFDAWADEGFVELTEGDVTDYDALASRLEEIAGLHELQEVAIHRYNTIQFQADLNGAGYVVVPFNSTYAHMAGPTAETERLLVEGKLHHGGNPVLRWMASNIAVRKDNDGNIRPDQEASGGRISGMIAMIMAIGRAVVSVPDEPEAGLQIFF